MREIQQRAPRPWGLVGLVVVLSVVAGAASGWVSARLFAGNSDDVVIPAVCPSPDAGGLAVAQLVAEVSPSVVSISVILDPRDGTVIPVTGAASGFIFDTDGHIVTNQHVVEGATSITVTTAEGSSYTAAVMGSDEANDIAVLRIEAPALIPLELGASEGLRLGDRVVAISNWRAPEGGPTASLGIVSAFGRDIMTAQGRGYSDLIQTDAAMTSGDSGGPLVDAEGRVVGVMVAGSISGQCVGFAVPIERAIESVAGILDSSED